MHIVHIQLYIVHKNNCTLITHIVHIQLYIDSTHLTKLYINNAHCTYNNCTLITHIEHIQLYIDYMHIVHKTIVH